MRRHKFARIGLTLCLTTSVLTGCGEPEIAAVLDDYCQFHKDCGYQTATQFEHSLKACKRFHKDLLNQTSDGQPSGCGGEVEAFFIDFMHAQMDAGCSADLMQSLNQSQETQQQLTAMLACAQSGSDENSDSVADMGLNIVEQLDLDINHMEPGVCNTIISAIMPSLDDKVETICSFDLSQMTVDGCNALFSMLEQSGSFSFGSVEFRQRICGLFTHADTAE